MKLSRLSLVAATLVVTSSFAADSISSMFADGKVKGEIRGYYMHGDRTMHGNVDADRVGGAVGGHLKYETASFNGLSLGASFYTANGLGLNSDAAETARTSLLDGDDAINVLAEAYAQYAIGNTVVKIGRQMLNTPWVNGDDSRMVPNTFEAYTLINSDLPDTTIIASHVTKAKKKNSNDFVSVVPTDEAVNVLAAIYAGIPNTTIKLFEYYSADTINVFVAEAGYKTAVSGIKLGFDLRYVNQKDVGDNKIGEIDTDLITARVKASMDNGVSFGLGVASVGDQDLINLYTSDMAYTALQLQRETSKKEADSVMGYVGYDFSKVGVKGLKAAFKYTYAEFDANDQYSPAGKTWETDTTNEWNIDVKYKIDANNKVRLRYASVDYDLEETEHDELRLYYFFNF